MVLKNHLVLKDTRNGRLQSEAEKNRSQREEKGERTAREQGRGREKSPRPKREASYQVICIQQGEERQYHRTGKETWTSPGGSHVTHKGNCWWCPAKYLTLQTLIYWLHGGNHHRHVRGHLKPSWPAAIKPSDGDLCAWHPHAPTCGEAGVGFASAVPHSVMDLRAKPQKGILARFISWSS